MRDSILKFKHSIVKAYGWSLHDIDETNFDSLFSFVNFNPDEATDGDTMMIDGKISRRVKGGAPSWL